MSGNGFNYYYQGANTNYPDKPWNNWTAEQHQFNNSGFIRNTMYDYGVQSQNTVPPPNTHIPPPRTTHYNYHTASQNTNNRPYHPHRRYNNANSQYPNNQQPNTGWNRNPYYKRPRLDSNNPSEQKNKAKKKKKPLSQNVPSRKDWTIEDAEAAWSCEKEYNKRHKNQSLIIKFPDRELNKDIVSKFHSSIENVHFQQPSTARFCFVTLEETADAEAVINTLNTIKFGEGHLTAEYKKDKEEEQNLGPEDIDPLTLYVGNLAQEITKEDMVRAYPNCKRIDIGYAKKMKYTRYAFVTFKTVPDCIEAFKKTHSTQMYSKSLIVRFRRLHGTVGMPGETKPQNPPKNKENSISEETETSTSNLPTNETSSETSEPIVIENVPVNLNSVKQEPETDEEYEEEIVYETNQVKKEVKVELEAEDEDYEYAEEKAGSGTELNKKSNTNNPTEEDFEDFDTLYTNLSHHDIKKNYLQKHGRI